jgi:hypothetical protein
MPTRGKSKSFSRVSFPSINNVKNMRKIDKKTGEILDIKTIGLWAPLPIPAFQVLARQRNWKAQRLLTCREYSEGGGSSRL